MTLLPSSTLCLSEQLSLLQPQTEQGQKLFPPTPQLKWGRDLKLPHFYMQQMTSGQGSMQGQP